MPIRLALVNDYEVVVRGLNSMLRNYHDDFAIVELNANTEVSEPVDIALFDVFAPSVAAGSRVALEIAATSDDARETLRRNTALFRDLMTEAGFEILPGEHPITPVMFRGDDGAREAARVADDMLAQGVYVIAFSFPVVPRGEARIRVQLSAAHSEDDVRRCVSAFVSARG